MDPTLQYRHYRKLGTYQERSACVCVCEGIITLTWRGSDAQVAAEVILQCGQHGAHVLLQLVQADDVLHQGGVDAHLSHLALGFHFREGERSGQEKRQGLKPFPRVLMEK